MSLTARTQSPCFVCGGDIYPGDRITDVKIRKHRPDITWVHEGCELQALDLIAERNRQAAAK